MTFTSFVKNKLYKVILNQWFDNFLTSCQKSPSFYEVRRESITQDRGKKCIDRSQNEQVLLVFFELCPFFIAVWFESRWENNARRISQSWSLHSRIIWIWVWWIKKVHNNIIFARLITSVSWLPKTKCELTIFDVSFKTCNFKREWARLLLLFLDYKLIIVNF